MMIISMEVAIYLGTQTERTNVIDNQQQSVYTINEGGENDDRTIGY